MNRDWFLGNLGEGMVEDPLLDRRPNEELDECSCLHDDLGGFEFQKTFGRVEKPQFRP